jgi:threonine dehydratase
MVHEIKDQMKCEIPDAIICCVGGGGLLGGILKGTSRCIANTVSFQ